MTNITSSHPKVTVLMPVYNGEKYVREAVESILDQTYSDFELLIIDDASIDGTYNIISSFQDSRIRIICNSSNQGISRSLNTGLQEASGHYIARMDCDDISLPERLAEQVEFLDAHSDVVVLGVKVLLIDSEGNSVGLWKEDTETTTFQQIKETLLKSNCIAHPGVLMRTSIISKYKYRHQQIHTEDYDLWLRLVADGFVINKLDRHLLKYRMHSESITHKASITRVIPDDLRMLAYYLLSRWGHFRFYDCKVAASLVRKSFNWLIGRGEYKIRKVGKQLLVMAGQFGEFITHRREVSPIFFIFPVYHIGGAEIVHGDIVETTTGMRPWIIFSDQSKNTAMRHRFEGKGNLVEISSLLTNIYLKYMLIGFWSSRINRTKYATVFGSNSMFFYELIPYFNDDVYCIDLIHASGGIEDISLSYVNRINRRIVISNKIHDDLRIQYKKFNLPIELVERIHVVENKVSIPAVLPHKSAYDKIRVLYVGRGSEEKRVHLFGKIAKKCNDKGLRAEFTLVGDVIDSVRSEDRKYCKFTGELQDPARVTELYRKCDLLLITSSSEGFPLVIMEAMACGVVPISTDVGGISYHVKSGITGFIVENYDNEDEIVGNFVYIIELLQDDPELLKKLSVAVYQYALEHFSGEKFKKYYSQLLAFPHK